MIRRALIGGVVLEVACGRSGYVPLRDPALPMHLTVAFKIDGWTSVPDQILYLDNPTFHVVFDDNGDGLCP